MQPYFFPYIGYFQLLNAVDKFVVYDNIQFTKKGWINRNRILVNGTDELISIPLKKDSDYLDVKDRQLADTWHHERAKIISRIKAAYKRAPNFDRIILIIEKCLLIEEYNLFKFLLNSLSVIKDLLGVSTPIIVSSDVKIDHHLRSDEKVISICQAIEADSYINPIGGVSLYDKSNFKNSGVDLSFLKTDNIIYQQFNNSFLPSLSIIDVLMFNPIEKVQDMLTKFTLE